MSANTMWVKTHDVLNNFIEKLTCTKCHKKFESPRQFLNCGHFACAKCIGSKTECIQCKIPGEVSDIYFDRDINDLLLNLNIIAEAVGLTLNNSSTNCNSESSSVKTVNKKNSKNIKDKAIVNKTNRSKKLKKNINASVCESTFSKSTYKSKINETIPKNINKKNKKGETFLHTACRSNIEDRIKILLEAGANPNTKDFAGWTPLQEAASYKFYNVCEILLKAGASPDMCGYDNRTALHEAVLNDDYDIASLLINSKANTKVFDNVGKTPGHYCKSKKMADLLKNLQEPVENISELSFEPCKTLDLDQSRNSINSESKIVLYGSDLNQKNHKLLIELGIEKKLKVVNTLSSLVSHVVIDASKANCIKSTFDILYTILCGKWLVSSDCLLILKESDDITVGDFSLFEVNPPHLDDGPSRSRENVEKQNPKLFNNCYFYFVLKNYDSLYYDGMEVTKENLTKLVTAGDGVILKREPKPEDIQGSLIPFHVAHDSKHSLHKCTHYIIYFNSDTNSNRIVYNMPFLKTLPFLWFIESILKFRLVDPVDLGLL